MSTELEPVVGQWYKHLDKGQMFVVTGVDDVEGIVDIQHYDGDLEEIDAKAWFDMDLELAEAPEDWTGPVDDVETDDLGYSETAMTQKDWRASLEESRPGEEETWEDTEPEDERDEWAEGGSAEEPYGTEPER
jgi:hypothetical protein